MKRDDVIAALRVIAPLDAAEEWDNVGLVLEPLQARDVNKVLLTIDLTEAVAAEAVDLGAELVIAYHPPLFAPLRQVTPATAAGRTALRCLEAQVAVYSPHTALDAVPGGVNDWLADGLGPGERAGLVPRGAPESGAAQGRLVRFGAPLPLSAVVDRIKQHLGVARVRVAAVGDQVRSVALCAGAGGEVLAGVPADVYWTGEMRHHDVLAANAAGASVVLCGHTETERGYLPRLGERLTATLAAVEVHISSRDRAPLRDS